MGHAVGLAHIQTDEPWIMSIGGSLVDFRNPEYFRWAPIYRPYLREILG